MTLSSRDSDFLEHFRQDAVVVTPEFTKHTNYKSDITRGIRKEPIEVKWYRKRHIGSGTYGEVWLEVKEDEGGSGLTQQRAVKVIDKNRVQRLGIDYKREVLALAKFSKPQYQQEEVLIKFLAWFEFGANLYLCMEYFEYGDLEKHIADIATEDDVKDIAINVLNGLSIMHNENFAHRDLKPGNIFVVQRPPAAAHWWVKIGDFGISKRVTRGEAEDEQTALRTQAGTIGYQAPEINGCIDFNEEPTSIYDNSVDLWSVGCIIYKLATKTVPFPTLGSVTKFCNGISPFPAGPLFQKFNSGKERGGGGVDFVKSLIVPDARRRPSAEEALNMPWLLERSLQLSARPNASSLLPSHDDVRHGNEKGKETATERKSSSPLQWPFTDYRGILQDMNNVARSLYRQEKFKEAESVYRQIYEHQKMLLGSEDPDTLNTMSTIAILLNNQGMYESAENMHRDILGIRKKVLGPEEADTLTSMNNLGNSLNNQGKHETAEKIYRHTLELREKVLGHEDTDTLKTLHSLATSLHAQKRYGEAESTYRQTLALRQKVLGSESVDTLKTMNGLANTLNNQKKYKLAEGMHREVLNLRYKVLGPRHPETLISAKNLARSLENQGKYNDANKLLAELEIS